MQKLPYNWLTEGLVDFEYKKYTLLAYLQYISKHFTEKKLYPFLAELIVHHQGLVKFRQNKEAMSKQFPKKVKKIDFDQFRLEYERVMNDAAYLEEIQRIVNFSLPQIEQHLNNGKEIYDEVEQWLTIYPIGIIPLKMDEGYMLLANGKGSDTQVYSYQLTIFENANERYRAIKTAFIDSYVRQFSNTYESIKMDLVKRRKELPNPATFVIASNQNIPLRETFLPIAKRSFVRFISDNV